MQISDCKEEITFAVSFLYHIILQFTGTWFRFKIAALYRYLFKNSNVTIRGKIIIVNKLLTVTNNKPPAG